MTTGCVFLVRVETRCEPEETDVTPHPWVKGNAHAGQEV